MSDLKLLLEFRTEALCAIRGSTASAAVQDALCAHVDRTLNAAAGRSAAAVQRSLERSQAVREGIVQAAGALPVDARGAAGVVQRRIERRGPEFYALRRVPDVATIRATLREKHSAVSEPESAPADISAPQNRSHG